MTERKAGNSIRKILVGVDGSDKSIAALKWASELAAKEGAHVDVLNCWQTPFPTVELIAIGFNLDMSAINDRPAEIAQYRLEKTVHAVYGEPHPKNVDFIIEEGYAGLVLVERSANVDLLVLGNRGHSPIVENLLGSVSTHCVSYAHCPVVIIK